MLIKEEFNQTIEYIKPAIDAIICTTKGSHVMKTNTLLY